MRMFGVEDHEANVIGFVGLYEKGFVAANLFVSFVAAMKKKGRQQKQIRLAGGIISCCDRAQVVYYVRVL
jgi:hypothetical protein